MPISSAGFFKDNKFAIAVLEPLDIPWPESEKFTAKLESPYIMTPGY